jgi:DNA-binding winged helix-turn-helix (wHTH) protein
MNSQHEQEFPQNLLLQYRNIGARRRDGRGHRVQAEAAVQAFSFGPFRVVPYSRLLERSGSPVPVGSRAFDILCLLISRPGEVVSKDELMARAWPDATVEESNLRLNIYALRRVLGDRQGGIQYVVNVPGRGYCFAANVEREAAW